MAKKAKKLVIGLRCTVTNKINYTMYKSKDLKEKIKVQKYCPELKRHTLHEEVKISG